LRLGACETQNSEKTLFFPLQVIGINNQFPGPLLNVTTNQNVRVNVQNNLDEPLLITWYLLLMMPL
jgi:FtsP/CotA-like multicopper oxidase with cupredoxin domain